MKLEEAIQSTKPMSPHQRALLNVLYTASWLDCLLHRTLRPYNITLPQYNILRILHGSAPKGLSMLDIKSRMLDRSSNVSRLVEKLRLSTLVERIASGDDRRMVVVTISEPGRQILNAIAQILERDEKMIAGGALSAQDAAHLADLLDCFRE